MGCNVIVSRILIINIMAFNNTAMDCTTRNEGWPNKSSRPDFKDGTIRLDARTHCYFADTLPQIPFTSVTTLIGWYLPSVDVHKLFEMKYGGTSDEGRHGLIPISRDDTLRRWAAAGKEAREKGTKLHLAIEAYYKGNNPIVDGIELEFHQFQAFQSCYGLLPCRAELMIYSTLYQIGGTVDLLASNEDGSYSIFDWKRTAKDLGGDFGINGAITERGVGPLRSWPNTSLGRYSMQLNLYRVLLEEEYGIFIRGMYIVQFHPLLPVHVITQVTRCSDAELLLVSLVHN